MDYKILIVEDEAKLCEVVGDYFKSRGDVPCEAENGERGVELCERYDFDDVLMDILMPGMDGFAACREIRKTSAVPVLFLTALSEEENKLRGYGLGADDYVTKPFSLSVLYARTEALIRRSRGTVLRGDMLSCGKIELSASRRRAWAEGRELKLAPMEFDLLECLIRNKNYILTPIKMLSGGNTNELKNDPDAPIQYREIADMVERIDGYEEEKLRLQRALDYARESEKRRRELTSAAAHELKTPIAIIRSYAEGLAEHIADDKRDKYLEVITGEADRMSRSVSELLELSRLEAGAAKLNTEKVEISELVRGVFNKLDAELKVKRITIIYDMSLSEAEADSFRTEQAVRNFAVNAIEHTAEGGRIWVSVKPEKESVCVAVENEGKGVPEEELPRLWETFYKADKSRARASGSGLGLAIVRSIVKLHGGRCDAENTERGVKFFFTLPSERR